MATFGAQFLLVTLICSLSVGAACAAGAWWLASRATRKRKAPPSTLSEGLEARFARIEADQAELFSTLERVTTTTKRLTSRAGLRERQNSPDALPVGTPKAELRKAYGIAGMSGPEQARMQLQREQGAA